MTVTCTFSSTGSEQSLVVPAGVASVHVDAIGGTGGDNADADAFGGFGGTVSADVAVTAGSTLFIDVGGNGSNAGVGGLSGSGASGGGGGFFFGAGNEGGGGGGASLVQTCSAGDSSCTAGYYGTSEPRLVVAGGGGGGGGFDGCAAGSGGGGLGPPSTYPLCNTGGGGGGNGTGGSGQQVDQTSGCVPPLPFTDGGGGGATPSAPGAGGNSDTGQTGQAGSGPTGGNGYPGATSDTGSGGGGGGGYYGGGGGGGTTNCGAYGFGGGAGSSFAAGTNVTYGNDTTATPSVTISYTLASTSTSVSAPATGVAGTAIAASSISATLSGATSAASGTITFTVFGPQSSPPTACTSGGATVGTATVSGGGTYHPSAGFTPPSAGTYYWYASYSGDGGNQPSNSGCGTGMTSTVVSAPAKPPAGKPPTVVTGAAMNVTQTSAAVTGTVNPNGSATTFYFQYGTSTAYGKQTSTQNAGSDTTTHAVSVSISGLSPGTTYHFRIVATNAEGTTDGADMTFTTPKRPLALSVSPTHTQAGTACFAFKASSNGHPVAGATVRFANHTARTSHAGKATICLTLRLGTYHPGATKTGYGRAHATITATAPPKPSFTG